jgi:HK97 family phage prohead protease
MTVPILTKAAGTDDHETLYAPLLEVKAADDGSGEVEGFAAVFNTADLEGDLILPGAFKKTLAAWRRSPGRIPLVDGHLRDASTTLLGSVVRAEERTGGDTKGLWFRAGFSSDAASQVVRTKALERHLNGVSIGWLPYPGGIDFKTGADGEVIRLLKDIRLFEISLTPIPMHPDARLTAVKAAIGSHSTATSTGSWDSGAQEKRLPNEAGPLRAAHAWRDPNGDPATKDAYRFIHHEVSPDGKVGPANLTACSAGIGVLNGGRGGTTIPDSDRQGVYQHLAAHLRSADREAPALKAWMDFDTFAGELEAALALRLPLARKAAVDAILAGYHNPGEAPAAQDDQPSGPAGSSDDQPSVPQPVTSGDGDPRAYAVGFLRHPLEDGSAGTPLRHPLADPLQVAQLTADQKSGSLDQFEAEVRRLLEGAPE